MDYNFCFDKKGRDGYKINNDFNLNGQIKLSNFKKDRVYLLELAINYRNHTKSTSYGKYKGALEQHSIK